MSKSGLFRRRSIFQNNTKIQSTRKRASRIDRAAIGTLEQLEKRVLFSLLGVSPGFPSIFYDTTGKVTYTYNPVTMQGNFLATATPRTFTASASGTTAAITNGTVLPRSLTISINVDSSGNVIGSPAPSLMIDGKLTDPTTHAVDDGILLQGDIEKFGYQYNGTGSDDFDFQFAVDSTNGGALAPYFAGKDIGIVMLSTASTFNGTFTQSFTAGQPVGAGANGNVGPVPKLVTPPQPGSLAGTVFEDFNNDGFESGPDAPIQGVEVTLNGTDYQGNSVSETTFTAANGSYSFSNLQPSGSNGYTIDEIQSTVPAPLLDGKDSVGTLGGENNIKNEFNTIPLAGGQNGVFYNFGEIPPGTVSGSVFCDDNTDGVYETGSDDAIGGATLTLSGTDDLGDAVSLVTGSASDGSYSFGNLRPGNYTVSVSDGDSTHALETAGSIGPAALAVGGTNSGDNFGYVQLTPVAGQVVNDATSTGINGVNVTLSGVNYMGAAVGPLVTTTSGNGNFSFGSLLPGSYTITEGAVGGYFADQSNAGVAAFTLAGCDNANVFETFGEIPPTSISGTKYNDRTGDGITSDDSVLSGVTINLYQSGGSVPLETTTTGNDGSYSFLNLHPGNYFVQESVSSGWIATVGGAGYTINAAGGSSYSNTNFANFQTISISGMKFNDLTGNGFSSDDPGQSGVKMDLYLNGGTTPTATTTTIASGAYSFSNLGPGNYSVQEEIPGGAVQTGGVGGYAVSASSGVNVSNENFDNFQTITISGMKFTDITGNGFTSDDTGLGGVTINLYKNGGTTAVATAVTAMDGSYSFSNLGPGSYSVQESVPAGWVQTAGNAGYSTSAVSGQNVPGDNFDDFQLISISGKKFNDLTGNGITSDDPGLSGVTINLYKNGGTTPSASTMTASDGTYSFTNLGPGSYSVQEAVPSGWTQTAGVGGYSVPAKSGVNSSGDNFADFSAVSISGTKYTDITGNGITSDDTVLSGVTINLYKNGGTTPFATTTTAANGTYGFIGLGAGTYVVQESVPSGWTETVGTSGYTVNGVSGVSASGENFADFKNITISGVKTKDLTGNGFSSDDPVLSGVTVNLYRNGGATAVATTTSGANGAFSFANLGPGNYSVQEAVPSGWTQTGGVGGYSVAGSSGVNYTTANFDDFQNISISGTKYNDLTDNGLTSDDTGLGGVTINLFKNGGTTAVANTVTASNGTYSFTNLGPGSYSVQEVVPSGWVQTAGVGGYSMTATCGTNVTGKNFADFQLLTISGIKYNDVTGNGMSSDDTVLGGVTVQLFKDVNGDGKLTSADGSAIASTVTAAGTGAYSFGNLLPGKYLVSEVVPSGWVQTGPATTSFYAITATATTKTYTGNNFDDFYEECVLSNTSSYYFLINNSTTHYTTMSNNVHEGDEVTVVFTLKSADTISLVSYTAPSASWVPAQAPQQVLFDQASGTYSSGGTYSLSITVPMCYFQVDFVCGPVISQLGAVGSNILYSNQNRLFQADNAGTDAQFSGGGSLAGYVFNDVNKNKLMDAGDLGIANAVVTLTGKDSTGHSVTLTRLTSASGYYYFKGLKAGTYTLTETLPTGYTASAAVVGTMAGKAAGTANSTTMISNIALSLTSSGINYDFGDLKR